MDTGDSLLSENDLHEIINQISSRSRQNFIRSGLTDESLFNSLLATASTITVSATHSSTAIQALLSFIQLQKSEKNGHLAALLFASGGWLRCLDLIIQRSESTKPKLVRHFLDLILSLLKLDGSPDIHFVLSRLFKHLHNRSSRGKVKPSLQIITILLSKRILSAEKLVNSLTIEESDHGLWKYPIEEKVGLFLQDLFYWAQFHELAPSVGQIASHICSELCKTRPSRSDQLVSLWIRPLLDQLRKTPEALSRFKSHVFPELFQSNLDHYKLFLEELGLDFVSPYEACWKDTNFEEAQNNHFDNELLFVTLQVGKEIGLVLETDMTTRWRFAKTNEALDQRMDENDLPQDGKIRIETQALCRLFFHTSSTARLAGLSLLVTSISTTKPFSTKALKGLKKGLPTLFIEQDAKIRQDMLALISHMIDRIKAAVFKLNQSTQRLQVTRSSASLDEAQLQQYVVDEHKDFLRWLTHMIPFQLYPEAGYQRHIFALKLLNILVKSEIDPSIEPMPKAQIKGNSLGLSVNVFTTILDRSLRDLLMNPFEDIRSMAATLLAASLRKLSPQFSVVDSGMAMLIERAEVKTLQSGRADHADGLARMYAIIFQYAPLNYTDLTEPNWWHTKLDIIIHLVKILERSIYLANQNIALAVTQFPMHGLLLGIR
jgi:hypothetical protein